MKRQINIQIESDMLCDFDIVRGLVTRSAYLRNMIKNEIAAAHGSLLQDNTECGMTQNHLIGGTVNE